MKKLFATVIALTMTLALFGALAEEVALPDLSEIVVPDYAASRVTEEKLPAGARASVTTDRVSIDGSQYTIATSDGVVLDYTAADDVLALTQDIAQQSDLYVFLYKEPLAMADEFVSQGMHLNLYKYTSNVDVYLHIFDTSMAAIFQNSNAMSDEEAEYVYEFMKKTDGYFPNATDGACGWLGGNVWFLGDCRQTEGVVYMVSFVGGKEIYCYARIDSDEQYSDLIDMLDSLTMTAA